MKKLFMCLAGAMMVLSLAACTPTKVDWEGGDSSGRRNHAFKWDDTGRRDEASRRRDTGDAGLYNGRSR